MPRRSVDLVAAALAVLGIALQIAQDEDPRFPFAYFTVLSASLVPISTFAFTVGRTRVGDTLSHSAQAGVLVSALVYWLAIAPANGMGTEMLTQTANWTLHLLVPAAVLWQASNHLRLHPAGRPARLRALWFPTCYLIAVLGFQAVGHSSPYAFLDVGTQTPGQLVAAAVFIGCAYVGVGLLLDEAARWTLNK